jgi:adenine-specific DNA-methyltransferase
LGSVIWGKNGIKWFGDFFNNIPIPVASDVQKMAIKTIVNNILDAKKTNSEADIIAFENQINKLVFELYELTEEEIKIVEDANA